MTRPNASAGPSKSPRARKRGFLAYKVDSGNYHIDRASSVWSVAGELLLREVLAARKYMRGRLLDVGCGIRPYALIYDEVVDQSIGTEVAYSPHGTAAADVICSADSLPFPDESFDTILCTEVLEHTRRPWLAIGELARVACAGSHVIISVPFIYPEHEAPNDYWRFTVNGIRSLCEDVDLHILEVGCKGGPIATALSLWANVAVRGVNAISRALRRNPPLRETKLVRWAIAFPQVLYLWAIRNGLGVLEQPPVSRWMSPGFFVIARKITKGDMAA